MVLKFRLPHSGGTLGAATLCTHCIRAAAMSLPRDESDPPDATRVVTWAGLLARWMEFARSAVALPTVGDGARWRASIAPVIALHAVAMALRELHLVAETDRPLARDRAAITVADACAILGATWRGEPMPESMAALRDDALLALELAAFAGAVELRWLGPGILVMPDLGPHSIGGTLCIAPPGTPMMPSEPIAWWVGRPGVELAECVTAPVVVPRQVYRQLDLDGRAVRDLLVPLNDEPPPGMPLLVPLYEDGHAVGHLPQDVATWAALQRGAMPSEGVPVVASSTAES